MEFNSLLPLDPYFECYSELIKPCARREPEDVMDLRVYRHTGGLFSSIGDSPPPSPSISPIAFTSAIQRSQSGLFGSNDDYRFVITPVNVKDNPDVLFDIKDLIEDGVLFLNSALLKKVADNLPNRRTGDVIMESHSSSLEEDHNFLEDSITKIYNIESVIFDLSEMDHVSEFIDSMKTLKLLMEEGISINNIKEVCFRIVFCEDVIFTLYDIDILINSDIKSEEPRFGRLISFLNRGSIN